MIKRLLALTLSLIVRGFDLFRSLALQWSDQPMRHSGVVLYYHAVKTHQRPRFARQMDELLKRTYPFSAGSPETMTKAGRNVAVTFDDGFQSVVENALPELAMRCIPFTVFVPTGCLGKRPSWVHDPGHPSWEETVLSATDLRALASHPLATLGSHSVTHRNLLELDSDQAAREFAVSKAELQAATGIDIDLFSYPHGAYSPALVHQARQSGYRRVFTIEPTTIEPDLDWFTVGRVAADPEDWSLEFRLKIAGAYRWRHYFHRRREPMWRRQ